MLFLLFTFFPWITIVYEAISMLLIFFNFGMDLAFVLVIAISKIILGIEKNPVKGEGIERKNWTNPENALMNAPVISLGIMIIGKIDTIEIVIGIGKEIEKGKGIVAVKEIEAVIVIEGGIVVVIMSVTGTMSVTALMKKRRIMKLGILIMIVAVLVIRCLIMMELNQSMAGTSVVIEKEIMTTLNQKMSMVGMISYNMDTGIQILTMILSIMNVHEDSLTLTLTMIIMNNTLIMVVKVMIRWKRIIAMIVEHHVKKRSQDQDSESCRSGRSLSQDY